MVAKPAYEKPAVTSTLTEQEVFGSETLIASAWQRHWSNTWSNGPNPNGG